MSFSLADLNPFKVLIDKALSFIPDPQKKAEMQLELTKEFDAHSENLLATLTAVDSKQIDVNIEEAKSTDPFVSRARPAVMWICAFGLSWECIWKPVISTVCVLSKHAEMVAQMPAINGEVLMTVLGYMLGYGGMRTWEKTKGVAATR